MLITADGVPFVHAHLSQYYSAVYTLGDEETNEIDFLEMQRENSRWILHRLRLGKDMSFLVVLEVRSPIQRNLNVSNISFQQFHLK